MSRRLRFIPLEGAMVEITCRTFQARYLPKPSPAVNGMILGVLGRAQRLYPIEIHAFVFMSNHYHLLISVPDARRMADFMRYFNSNLARELGKIPGWCYMQSCLAPSPSRAPYLSAAPYTFIRNSHRSPAPLSRATAGLLG